MADARRAHYHRRAVRPLRALVVLALPALGLAGGCHTAGDGGGTAPDEALDEAPDPQQEHLQRLEAIRATFDQQQTHLQAKLPPILARFRNDDPGEWSRAKAAIEADPLLLAAVAPRPRPGVRAPDSPLLWATDRNPRGERARADLVFLGRAYEAAAGFDSPDPADWTRARERLQALGERGVDSAAIAILLRLRPLDLPAGAMRRLQDELAALGPGALRVLRVALEVVEFNVAERLLPVLQPLGEPAVDLLLALCDHERDDVVRFALKGLATAPHPRAVPRLRRFLGPEQSWMAQSYALAALGRTPGPEAGAAILEACGHADPSVARFAAQAAAEHHRGQRDADAVRALLRLLGRAGDEWQEARAAAREALQQVTGLRRGTEADFEQWLNQRTR